MKEKYNQAVNFLKSGKLDKAKVLCLEILEEQPDDFDTLRLFALISFQDKNYHQSLDLISRAIKIKPDFAEIYNFYSIVLIHLKKIDEAIKSWNDAIKIKPDYAEAYYNRANALSELRRFNEAVESYDKAIQIKPDYAEAYYNRGIALLKLGRLDEAIESYDKAIQIKPDYAEVHNNRGNALLNFNKLNEAIESYDKAIQIKPDYAEAYYNRANALSELRRFNEAVESYDKAIQIKPDSVEFHYNRGIALIKFNKLEDALQSYDRAIKIKPDHNYLLGQYFHLKNKMCDWSNFNENLENLKDKILKLKTASIPWSILSIYDSPLLQKISAETYLKSKYSKTNILKPIIKREPNKKIRIGYFTANFRDHAQSYLLVKALELHDKSKFELIGFSLNPVNKSHDEMYKRISSIFDQFIDVGSKSDIEIVEISRDIKIDIAVDLMGFTQNNKFRIFIKRCAPIQINYLGYPGTSGSNCMDYLIGDKIVIPKENQKFFTEKIAYMPNTYQANGSEKQISKKKFTREEFGLPKNSFVFCCFNQNYKINPETFDLWIEILNSVNNSVLWLFEADPIASKNLKKELEVKGLNPCRIIFAKKMSQADHLARHQLADLFIDSFPYTAHTTCSDALWAGLPVLTRIGNSFASRVAASLLAAIDLSEMIVKTKKEYKDLAIEIANNKEKLKQIKNKLQKNILTKPLFDTKLFTKNIEELYSIMYQRYHSGLPTDHIEIEQRKNN